MTEYAVWNGKVVSVLKRRSTPDGKTPVSLLIQDGETKHSVMPSEVSPYRPGGAKAQAAAPPTSFPVELSLPQVSEAPRPEFEQLEINFNAPAVEPTASQEVLPDLPEPTPLEGASPVSDSPVSDIGKVYVNQVMTIEPLTALPTIGKKSAEAILNRRALQPTGKYESLEDLKKVMTQFSYLNWEILKPLLIFD